MNVAFDPWIPVVTNTGKRKSASLSEVFSDGAHYADLAVRPHERVALMRLFLCVAHASLDGPKNYPEWCDVPKKLPEAALKYLEKWKDSFELFHSEKPWLQVAGLNLLPSDKNDDSDDEKDWSSLTKLCFTRASGNNSTLFDHESNGGVAPIYSTEEIALNLLTFQNFFVAGGKASSRQWGNVEMKNPSNPKGGPCSGKSILFTFLRGQNLIESIHLNLTTYEDLKLFYGASGNWLGKPIWERLIKSPADDEAITNATQTHLGRLVPQTRILRVHEDCRRVLFGAGIVYPKFQDEKNTFHPDLNATVVLNKEGERALLSARASKSIWRELHSLVVRNKSSSSSNRGPLCLGNIPEHVPCDITVSAMITNPKQAAEIIDLVDSAFHIPAKMTENDGPHFYESEVKSAEAIESRLGWAVEGYRSAIDGYWDNRLERAKQDKWTLKAKLHSIANTHYWTTAENNLPLLMSHIEAKDTDDAMPTRETWRKMLFAAACEAYRIACGQETPRQIRAFAKGWQRLTAKKDEAEADITEKKEDAA